MTQIIAMRYCAVTGEVIVAGDRFIASDPRGLFAVKAEIKWDEMTPDEQALIADKVFGKITAPAPSKPT